MAEVGGHLHLGPPKTYQTRTLVLPLFLRDELAAHLATKVENNPDALIFTAPKGGPLRLSNFRRRVWRPAIEMSGLVPGLRIHNLRHTCAALLISQGAPPKAVQPQLGHSSITTTFDRYGHLFSADLEALADGLDATYREAAADNSRTIDVA